MYKRQAFSRDPATGENKLYGEFLMNAQGEDVVAGIRNTSPIADLKHVDGLEDAGRELEKVFVTLENHFRDMCDIEFTIEQGKLWMLQTRVGKRTAAAALHIAIEMEKEEMCIRDSRRCFCRGTMQPSRAGGASRASSAQRACAPTCWRASSFRRRTGSSSPGRRPKRANDSRVVRLARDLRLRGLYPRLLE